MTLAFLAPAPRRFADPSADEPDDLAAEVQAEETDLRRAVLAAVQAMLALLDEAIAEGLPPDRDGMRRAFERVLTERGQAALERAYGAGAGFAFRRLPRSATLDVAFDLVNPDAVRWAMVHSAGMVTGVSDETMRAIRAMIVRALNDGVAPRDLARQIRPLIGLTERDALAVGNLQTRLIEEGRSEAAIDRLTTRYANRLLRRRAETIARTEIMTAANRGQEALWANAVRDGLLIEGEWERVWIMARDERLCTLCRPLDRKRAPMLGGSFDGGVGGPPRHPRCRCTTGLVRRSA